jgi:hypothetical protein
VPFDPELATRGLPGPTAGALADALGSSVPRVAEVAGLAVPAGTDWSHGRAIGTISGLLASSWLTGKLSIELAGAPADDLYLHVDETGDPTTAFAPCWINIGPGATTSGGPVGAVNRVGNIAWARCRASCSSTWPRPGPRPPTSPSSAPARRSWWSKRSGGIAPGSRYHAGNVSRTEET